MCVYIKLQYFSVHFLILQYFLSDPQAFLTYASSVQVGAQSGIHECKHQFALEKWNCPERTLQMSTHNTLRTGNTPLSAGDVLGACTTCTNTDVVPAVVPCTNHWTEKIKTSQSSCFTATVHASNAALTQYLMCNIQFESNFFFFYFFAATRETSFVHAISAAGVMYTLTKNCSMGDFDNCGCDDSKIGQTGTLSFLCSPHSGAVDCPCPKQQCVFVPHPQGAEAGSGGAAVTTWPLERRSPNSSWTRWKTDTTHELRSTCTTTRQADWYVFDSPPPTLTHLTHLTHRLHLLYQSGRKSREYHQEEHGAETVPVPCHSQNDGKI